jgi:hypothetical protein
MAKGNAWAWTQCEGFYESIKDLTAAEQWKRIQAKTEELDGEKTPWGGPRIENGVLRGVCAGDGLNPWTYLQPLHGMPLTSLSPLTCRISDLTPLKGMPLTTLAILGSRLSDLSPLKGMPLTSLESQITQVSDLGPLKGMPLSYLNIYDCKLVTDLGPLKGMPLTDLRMDSTGVNDLGPLKGMPLHKLKCMKTQVRDLGPLTGSPLKALYCDNTPVTDLTPLDGMRLEHLSFTPRNITKGISTVRNMKTLKAIGVDGNDYLGPATEFWKKYDAGEFRWNAASRPHSTGIP